MRCEVYEARGQASGRDVAVKVVHKSEVRKVEVRARLWAGAGRLGSASRCKRV